MLFLVAVLLLGLAAPWLSRQDPLNMAPRWRLQPPSSVHVMGTDEFGRDVWARVAYGSRLSIVLGLAVVAVTLAVGMGVGLLCGTSRRVDGVLMRVFDGWMAFPELILAITLAAIWGSGPRTIVFAMAFAYVPRMARVTRGAVLQAASTGFVEAARAIGASDGQIVWRHILPNALSPVIVQSTYLFASAILAEAALSFLGVGIQPPHPSWGGMISDARDYLPIAPWLGVFPGLALFFAVISINLLGDQLQDWLDPRG